MSVITVLAYDSKYYIESKLLSQYKLHLSTQYSTAGLCIVTLKNKETSKITFRKLLAVKT